MGPASRPALLICSPALSHTYIYDYTNQKKKRNQSVFVFSILLIGQKVLGDSFIRHVIDLSGVIVLAKQCFFTALSLSLVLALVGQL